MQQKKNRFWKSNSIKDELKLWKITRKKIDEIKEIGIRQEKLKIPKTTINEIKELIILEKYLHHILWFKKYCA